VLWTWPNAARCVESTVFSLKCAYHSAKSRRIDAMSLPLNLDSLQTARDFVDLEKCDQWHASKYYIAKYDLRVGIAEIDRAVEDQGALSKMREEFALWFTPEDALQQTLLRLRQLSLSRRGAENQQQCCEGPPTPA